MFTADNAIIVATEVDLMEFVNSLDGNHYHPHPSGVRASGRARYHRYQYTTGAIGHKLSRLPGTGFQTLQTSEEPQKTKADQNCPAIAPHDARYNVYLPHRSGLQAHDGRRCRLAILLGYTLADIVVTEM